MNIVFLDDQLMNQIRSHLTMRTTQGVQIAKTVDDERYTLSGLLALFDQHLLKIDTAKNSLNSSLKEIKLLEKFYKKSQVDYDFLENSDPNLAVSLTETVLHRLNSCLPFILYLQQCINQSVDAESKDTIQKEIFTNAGKFRIEGANPLIILAIAALYGHPLSKNIFDNKPREKTSSSGLSHAQLGLINIFLLPDLVALYSKQIWRTYKSLFTINYTLLTPNEMYNELLVSLEISGQPEQVGNKEPQTNCAFDINITAALFPEISENAEKINKLVSCLMAPLPQQEPVKTSSEMLH